MPVLTGCANYDPLASRRDVGQAVDLVRVRGPAVEHHLVGAEFIEALELGLQVARAVTMAFAKSGLP